MIQPSIKCTTPKGAIDGFFRQAIQITSDVVTKVLSKLGEECITRIRDRGPEESWIDHTGNLRSSIGYAVYDYGKKYIESSFGVVLQGAAGASEGRKLINELASQYSNVYALVVVAGMNYADKVEAIESKDVLASTESWAREVINERMKRAKDIVERKINALKI